MPDYNYDGFDDYTGIWKGFSRSRSRSYDDECSKEKPKTQEEIKLLNYRESIQREKAIQLNQILLNFGFNQTKEKTFNNLEEFVPDGYSLSKLFIFHENINLGQLLIIINEEHNYEEGFIFKKKIKEFKLIDCGKIIFKVADDKTISNLNVVFSNSNKEYLLESTVERLNLLSEELNQIFQNKPKNKPKF